MSTVTELRAQLAQAESEERKQRIADLQERHHQALWKAGEARERAEKLANDYRAHESEVSRLREAYEVYAERIAEFERAWLSEKFHSQKETAAYYSEKQSMEQQTAKRHQAFLAAKEQMVPMQLVAIKAEQEFGHLASIAQNLGNELERAKKEDENLIRFPNMEGREVIHID